MNFAAVFRDALEYSLIAIHGAFSIDSFSVLVSHMIQSFHDDVFVGLNLSQATWE